MVKCIETYWTVLKCQVGATCGARVDGVWCCSLNLALYIVYFSCGVFVAFASLDLVQAPSACSPTWCAAWVFPFEQDSCSCVLRVAADSAKQHDLTAQFWRPFEHRAVASTAGSSFVAGPQGCNATIAVLQYADRKLLSKLALPHSTCVVR